VTDTDGVIVSDTVTKRYGCRGRRGDGAGCGHAGFRARQLHCGDGAVWVGQIDAAALRRWPGPVGIGIGHAGRDGSGWHVRAGAGAAAPGADRFVFQSFNLPPELSASAAAVRLGRPALGGPGGVPGQALPRRHHRPGHPPRSRTTTPLTPSQGGRAPRTLACPLASPGRSRRTATVAKRRHTTADATR
jgi:hypothetical protein